MSIRVIIVVCTVFVTLNAFLSKKDYGDFFAKIVSFNFEISPKFKSSVEIQAKLIEFRNKTLTVQYHFRINRHLGVIGLKVRFFTWNESMKKFSQSFNIVMDNICQKQMAKEFLALIPGLTEKCDVNPGIYNFTIMDFDVFMHHFTPGKFFYGRYLILGDVHEAKNGRVVRFNVTTLFQQR